MTTQPQTRKHLDAAVLAVIYPLSPQDVRDEFPGA